MKTYESMTRNELMAQDAALVAKERELLSAPGWWNAFGEPTGQYEDQVKEIRQAYCQIYTALRSL